MIQSIDEHDEKLQAVYLASKELVVEFHEGFFQVLKWLPIRIVNTSNETILGNVQTLRKTAHLIVSTPGSSFLF